MNARTSRKRGFTLIEVLLVILILGMLATVAVLSFRGVRQGAKIDTTKLKLRTLKTALENYNMHVGDYPTEEQGGLKALITRPTFEDEEKTKKWRGPYLEELPKDAWDQEFHYELVDTASGGDITAPYKLWSDGPDRQNGTEDDIKSWKEEEGT